MLDGAVSCQALHVGGNSAMGETGAETLDDLARTCTGSNAHPCAPEKTSDALHALVEQGVMLPFIQKTPTQRELPLGPVPVPVAGELQRCQRVDRPDVMTVPC